MSDEPPENPASSSSSSSDSASRRLAFLSTALSGLRSGLLLARPVVDSVRQWQTSGTKTGIAIARTLAGDSPSVGLLEFAEAAALFGIDSVHSAIAGSLDLSADALKAARNALPVSEEEKLRVEMSPLGLLEQVLEILKSDKLEIKNGSGLLGAARTGRKIWAWTKVLERTEGQWMDDIAGDLERLEVKKNGGGGNVVVEQDVADTQLVAGSPAKSTTEPIAREDDYDVFMGTLSPVSPPSLKRTSTGSRVSAEPDLFDILDSRDPTLLPLQLKHIHRLARLCTGSYGEAFSKFLALGGRPPEGGPAVPPARPQTPSRSETDSHPSHDFLASHAGLDDGIDVLHSTHTLPAGSSVATALGTYHPLLFILRDPATKTITVVVRGTMSFGDLLCDLGAHGSPFRNGSIHSHFLSASKLLVLPDAPFMVSLKKALDSNPDYRLLLAGHSLGAAIASALALLLEGTLGRPVRAIALAPPALVTRDISTDPQVQKLITNVIVRHDPVPRLGIATIQDVKKVLNAMEDLNCASEITDRDAKITKLEAQLARLDEPASSLPGSMDPPDPPAAIQEQRRTILALLASHAAYFATIRRQILHIVFGGPKPPPSGDRFFPAGRLLWVYNSQLWEIKEPGAVLDGLVLTGESLRDHLPDRYEAAIRQLLI